VSRLHEEQSLHILGRYTLPLDPHPPETHPFFLSLIPPSERLLPSQGGHSREDLFRLLSVSSSLLLQGIGSNEWRGGRPWVQTPGVNLYIYGMVDPRVSSIAPMQFIFYHRRNACPPPKTLPRPPPHGSPPRPVPKTDP